MAKIEAQHLCFELTPNEIVEAELHYCYRFKWKGIDIFNPEVLSDHEFSCKGWLDAYADLCQDGVEPEEMVDPIVEMIRQVLLTDEAGSWEHYEPGMTLNLHPDYYFIQHLSHERTEGNKRILNKHTPDDLFTLLVYAQSYGFKGEGGCQTNGLMLNMFVTRKELEDFARNLEKEFFEVLKQTDEENLEC